MAMARWRCMTDPVPKCTGGKMREFARERKPGVPLGKGAELDFQTDPLPSRSMDRNRPAPARLHSKAKTALRMNPARAATMVIGSTFGK